MGQRKAAVKEALRYLVENSPATSWTARYAASAYYPRVKDWAPEVSSATWGRQYEHVWLDVWYVYAGRCALSSMGGTAGASAPFHQCEGMVLEARQEEIPIILKIGGETTASKILRDPLRIARGL